MTNHSDWRHKHTYIFWLLYYIAGGTNQLWKDESPRTNHSDWRAKTYIHFFFSSFNTGCALWASLATAWSFVASVGAVPTITI